MAYYTILGQPDCKNFAHAAYVAQYLYDHLPNFKYKKLEKSKQEWPEYVSELNKKNKWYMIKSPIIWKEISTWGGKSYLIGGLSEFWEYCYCYFGLESFISQEDLDKLARDNMSFFKEKIYSNTKEHRKYNVVISVLLESNQFEFLAQLMEELIKIPQLLEGNGLFVKVYEKDFDETKKDRKALENIEEYYNSLAIFGDRPLMEIVKKEVDVILKCDLLLFLEDFSLAQEEPFEIYIKRAISRTANLAELINAKAKRSLRIVFCNEGPRCFMATCMIKYCKVLLPGNIVAITADRGLSVISTISELTGVLVSKISAPPVWGFVGINEYIDESNIIFKGHIFKPFQRARTAPEESTLPLGTVVHEIRLMSYLLPNQHEAIAKAVAEKRQIIELKLGRKPFLNKIRTIVSLLKLWYAEEYCDAITSLGVSSNGCYGIPPGIVFSQPCIQDKRRKWRPFQNFPIVNEETYSKLKELIDEAIATVQMAHLDVDSLPSCSEDYEDLLV